MKKQHIARHDAMMRMLINGFTKGTKPFVKPFMSILIMASWSCLKCHGVAIT